MMSGLPKIQRLFYDVLYTAQPVHMFLFHTYVLTISPTWHGGTQYPVHRKVTSWANLGCCLKRSDVQRQV